MEATDARRAFPSWDEPAYKATFDISMMIDAGDTAISNGAQVSDTPGPEAGKHTVAFARTQKMSAYLVALLVGDFACRDGSSDGIALRVCSTPDKRALTGFALEAAEQQVKFYNEWTGIKYPFGKLDLIGVPDFSAGAMENAGAITFREEALLADQEHASLETRKQVASTISHEIAHQWFGDLVTMKWWDDIWLNEGFATWMANKPLAVWRPDWQVDLDEVEEAQVAVSTDALRATRPVRTRVETPDEINEVFDRIAYEKTASILRSIETYVGPDLMRTAVRSYLQHHAFSNASGEDFWTEVARVTGKPVDRVMKPYIEQPGVPARVGHGGRVPRQHHRRAAPSGALHRRAWREEHHSCVAALGDSCVLQDRAERSVAVHTARQARADDDAVDLCANTRSGTPTAAATI